MILKLVGAIVLVCGVGMVAAAQNSADPSVMQTLVGLEKSGWEALKGKDRAAAYALLPEDFVGVLADEGKLNRAEFIKLLDDTTIASYSMSDVTMTKMGSDSAVLTYKSKSSFTYKGEKAKETLWISSGWAKRDGKWLNVLYHETRMVN